jgi:4-carboxymuconolactone decarboxylase
MTDLAMTPRVAPLEPPYEPAIEAMLEKWMPRGSTIEPLALFRTLAVHDELFARMHPLGAGILGHGRIEPREREIVIHRACARAGAEYEWGVHVMAYGAAGYPEHPVCGRMEVMKREDAVAPRPSHAWRANSSS